MKQRTLDPSKDLKVQDHKNNVERLRKMRSLSIEEDFEEQYFCLCDSKVCNEKIVFLAPHFRSIV